MGNLKRKTEKAIEDRTYTYERKDEEQLQQAKRKRTKEKSKRIEACRKNGQPEQKADNERK